MLKEYAKLTAVVEEMASAGRNGLDPVIRSICRRLWKLYIQMSAEEKAQALVIDQLPF